MPQVVGAIAAFGSSVAASFGVALLPGSVAAFVVGAGAIVVGALALKKPKVGDVAERVLGRELTSRVTDGPRFICYGEVLIGGVLTWHNTASTENRQRYMEIVHTGHQINAFLGWKIDDRYVPIADVNSLQASPPGAGQVTADTNSHGLGPVDGATLAYLRGHLGTSTQLTDSHLDAVFLEIGTSPPTHRHRGCARTNARFDWLEGAEDRWDAGIPQNIAAHIEGKLCYDPRLDSTFSGSWGTGSGAHRVNDSTTWAYTRNPALCWADHRIDATLGPGWGTDRIDYNSVAIAADVCDASVEIPPAASPANTEPRYRCDLVLDTSRTPAENSDDILLTMNGTERYYNGQWHVFASGYPTNDFSLDESNLVGELQFRPNPEFENRFNQVKGTFIDPDRNWQKSAFPPWDDTTLRANRDAGETLVKEVQFEGVSSGFQCQRIARHILLEADDSGLLVFPAGYDAMDIRPGDTGTVSLSEFGWTNKVFRCVGARFVDFVGVELLLKEDDSTNYGDPAVGDYGTTTASGLINFPYLRPQDLYTNSYVLDPNFERSTVVKQWSGSDLQSNLAGGFWLELSNAYPMFSINRTGGLTGGSITLPADPTSPAPSPQPNQTLIAIARLPVRMVGAETVRVVVRVRKRFSTTLSSGQGQIQFIVIPASLGSLTFGTGSGFTKTFTDINSWTVDAWQTFNQTVVIAAISDSKTLCCAEVLYTLDPTLSPTAAFEIEYFNVIPVKT